MDKTIFYSILDIDNPSEFIYYENMQALLEEDDFIEANLVKDLLKDINYETFSELLDDYFEELLKELPEDDTDLYITVDEIHRIFNGLLMESQDELSAERLSDEILKFRKWYVQDPLVYDLNSGDELNVRDARYNLKAAVYLGEKCNYDFRMAYTYDADGYDVSLRNIVYDNLEEEDSAFEEENRFD